MLPVVRSKGSDERSGNHGHNGIIHTLAEDEVGKSAAEATVIDLGFQSDRAGRAGWNAKLKTHKV